MPYLLHIDARSHAFRIRRVLVAVLAIVVASTTVVVGTASRAGAAPLFSTPVITFNMQGATAAGVVVPGSQIQFADLDADGREDYLDVNPTTGATRAWINVG